MISRTMDSIRIAVCGVLFALGIAAQGWAAEPAKVAQAVLRIRAGRAIAAPDSAIHHRQVRGAPGQQHPQRHGCPDPPQPDVCRFPFLQRPNLAGRRGHLPVRPRADRPAVAARGLPTGLAGGGNRFACRSPRRWAGLLVGPHGGKGDRFNWPERPEGCFAPIGPVPFSAGVGAGQSGHGTLRRPSPADRGPLGRRRNRAVDVLAAPPHAASSSVRCLPGRRT